MYNETDIQETMLYCNVSRERAVELLELQERDFENGLSS
jgi:hypothetical protein